MKALVGWNRAERFEKNHQNAWTQEEILEKIREAESKHDLWKRIATIICFVGLAWIVAGVFLGMVWALHGLFIALCGVHLSFTASCNVNTTINTLAVIWDMRKREEEAVRQSEIEDL